MTLAIPHDVEVIGHVPPLPPIDLNPRRAPETPQDESLEELGLRLRRQSEATRIWGLVKQAAEGT